MLIENPEQLREEMNVRMKNSVEIAEKIDDYVKKVVGISNFSAKVDTLFSDDVFHLCLARQVATVNIEHVALDLFSSWLNASQFGFKSEAMPMSFVLDSYSGANQYKKSLVSLRKLKKNKGDNLFSQNEKIVPKKLRGNIEGKVFSGIFAGSGISLPDYHGILRRKTLNSRSIDVSKFYDVCLRESLNSGFGPSHYYVVNDEAKSVRVNSGHKLNGEPVRPPAEWFYLLHLLFFANGKRAMISTVEDCSTIDAYMSQAISDIKDICGFEPLLIDVPKEIFMGDYQSDLSEINEGVFNPDWEKCINVPVKSDLFSVFEHFEKEVISL